MRGCDADLPQEVASNCTGTDCQLCTNLMAHPGCNNFVFPLTRSRCFVCTADGNDTMCALPQTLTPQICPLFALNDRCFILRRGTTFARGCVSSENVCEDPAHCHTCDGHGCNDNDVNLLTLPEAPGSALINQATALLTLSCLAVVSLLKNSY